MKFSEQLFQKVQPIWEQSHQHPFVTGIGDGTLPLDRFQFYIVQDYLYLLDYAKVYALGVVKATDLQVMARFAKQIDGILNGEMSIHRHYAARLGITEEEIEGAKPAAMNLAYTNYMLSVAQNGTLAELVASLLPCMWSYWEIGKRLNDLQGAAKHPFYGEWIRGYSSEEYADLCRWVIELFDDLTEGKSSRELNRLEEIFLNTSRFEYLFWDMAYRKEMWGFHEQATELF
ncbi:thiaminase II [Ectobacillus ponti]|uniref:Aminopyrimidine aminohydrolase n=1 Tax=Ectobacillus ponti TaxID=2961894 RepID=A0AA42BNV9_9BACI|nr:thiaminase II [Ectobacillus ponti]MCP8968127.1 thiaminase II [Ectobacillus ponti]